MLYFDVVLSLQDKETFTAQILDVNQGGLISRCQSLQAFIPISQLNSKIRGNSDWLSIEVGHHSAPPYLHGCSSLQSNIHNNNQNALQHKLGACSDSLLPPKQIYIERHCKDITAICGLPLFLLTCHFLLAADSTFSAVMHIFLGLGRT